MDDQYNLAYKKFTELTLMGDSDIVATDQLPIYDISTGIVKRVAASAFGVSSGDDVRYAVVTATIAELNAGKTLVAAVTGKSIVPISIMARVVGSFAAVTSYEVEDSNGTPVVALTYGVTGLSDGAILYPDTANVTEGVGYGAALTISKALVVAKTGSDGTGGTSIIFTIAYGLA